MVQRYARTGLVSEFQSQIYGARYQQPTGSGGGEQANENVSGGAADLALDDPGRPQDVGPTEVPADAHLDRPGKAMSGQEDDWPEPPPEGKPSTLVTGRKSKTTK